ncbi:MAG: hypothetical protein Q9227_000748 [Pyrenula ochraceoflavens]
MARARAGSASEMPKEPHSLTFPPSFGTAHVGTTFSCSLCATNELAPSSSISIHSLHLTAEMQTPTQTVPLDITTPSHTTSPPTHTDPLPPGSSLNGIVRFPLHEEGNHVLAVNISYTESHPSLSSPLSSPSSPHQQHGQHGQQRTRSFRKLYQFQTSPALSIRTKTTELEGVEVEEKALGAPFGRVKLGRWVVECQLSIVFWKGGKRLRAEEDEMQ